MSEYGYDENSYRECELCDGIGKHEDGVKCDECNGDGEIKLTLEQFNEKQRDDLEREADLNLFDL
tara:strand:- start:208 stop:402 length:195 start_codon:yes stop_codon:yes gene_type:complete